MSGGWARPAWRCRSPPTLLPGFADGAWLCELAAASNNDGLVQVVAIALGVVQRPQMTLVESIVDFLRPRQLLVVLDNCEHLLDAAAELVQAILAGAPGVRVLATSREGLGVPGEHLWPLPSLALPSGLAGSGGKRRGRALRPKGRVGRPQLRARRRVSPGGG